MNICRTSSRYTYSSPLVYRPFDISVDGSLKYYHNKELNSNGVMSRKYMAGSCIFEDVQNSLDINLELETRQD